MVLLCDNGNGLSHNKHVLSGFERRRTKKKRKGFKISKIRKNRADDNFPSTSPSENRALLWSLPSFSLLKSSPVVDLVRTVLRMDILNCPSRFYLVLGIMDLGIGEPILGLSQLSKFQIEWKEEENQDIDDKRNLDIDICFTKLYEIKILINETLNFNSAIIKCKNMVPIVTALSKKGRCDAEDIISLYTTLIYSLACISIAIGLSCPLAGLRASFLNTAIVLLFSCHSLEPTHWKFLYHAAFVFANLGFSFTGLKAIAMSLSRFKGYLGSWILALILSEAKDPVPDVQEIDPRFPTTISEREDCLGGEYTTNLNIILETASEILLNYPGDVLEEYGNSIRGPISFEIQPEELLSLKSNARIKDAMLRLSSNVVRRIIKKYPNEDFIPPDSSVLFDKAQEIFPHAPTLMLVRGAISARKHPNFSNFLPFERRITRKYTREELNMSIEILDSVESISHFLPRPDFRVSMGSRLSRGGSGSLTSVGLGDKRRESTTKISEKNVLPGGETFGDTRVDDFKRTAKPFPFYGCSGGGLSLDFSLPRDSSSVYIPDFFEEHLNIIDLWFFYISLALYLGVPERASRGYSTLKEILNQRVKWGAVTVKDTAVLDYMAARILVEENNLDDAIRILNEVILKHADFVDAIALRARILAHMGGPEAVIAVHHALESAELDCELHLAAATMAVKIGDYDTAMAATERALFLANLSSFFPLPVALCPQFFI
eukprot:GHVP01019614.1.p1 GENE.GHVP01019614.1~~GHVP01019614.1.p1  ORF type:complete len:719 (-),score=106.59 GHVP01019614.1:217-2373(-)